MIKSTLRILPLGAGVQSTTITLTAYDGVLCGANWSLGYEACQQARAVRGC
jgi:hypothetical protein